MEVKILRWLRKVESEPLVTSTLRDRDLPSSFEREDQHTKPEIFSNIASDLACSFSDDLEFQAKYLLHLKSKNRLPAANTLFHEIWDSHPDGSHLFTPDCSLFHLKDRDMILTCIPNFDRKALYAFRDLAKVHVPDKNCRGNRISTEN